MGGRPRYKGVSKRGCGTDKAKVLGMVERDGEVRYQMMDRLTVARLQEVITENADLTCRIIICEYPMYRPVAKSLAGGHDFVTHGAGEYVRVGTDIHSNCIEGVFSLLKRGVMGTFHSVSKTRLANYLNEFEFRWNTRKANDGERVDAAIKACDGKRLEYRESVDNPPYLAVPTE